MDHSDPDTLLSRIKSAKWQLEMLRLPVAMVAVISCLVYPWAIFMAIMASDSGTPTAIRGSYFLLFGFTFYAFALIVSSLKWSDWPLLSAILLVPVTIANGAALILIPFIAARIALFPIGFLGVSLSNTTYTILGCIVFVLLFIAVPLLSIWRLFRHGYDLDVFDPSTPVHLWDLKTINRK